MEQTQAADAARRAAPDVISNYSGYEPPFDVESAVRRMIASVPSSYLAGLHLVVLTNKDSLSRERRRAATKSRKRKVRISEACGLYHEKWHGSRAWIEIFVDATLNRWGKGWWLKIAFWREGPVADVLFHEIGHHIQKTIHPEFREREDVADAWRDKLRGLYFRRKYGWLLVLAYPIKAIYWLRRVVRKIRRRV